MFVVHYAGLRGIYLIIILIIYCCVIAFRLILVTSHIRTSCRIQTRSMVLQLMKILIMTNCLSSGDLILMMMPTPVMTILAAVNLAVTATFHSLLMSMSHGRPT